jgi:hypothetical protein
VRSIVWHARTVVPLTAADRTRYAGVYTLPLPGGPRDFTVAEQGEILSRGPTSSQDSGPTASVEKIMRKLFIAFVLLVAASFSAQPASAQTAVCRDGTYSYSRTRSGTCSHHGGVAQWGVGSASSRRDGKVKQRPAGRRTSLSRATARQRTTRTVSRPARRPGRSGAASRGYYTGPRGGCYTYSASGRKRYVDRSYCR